MSDKLEMTVSAYKDYYFKDFKNIELRSCGVYGFRNNITGETYIGSTGETFKQRWGKHIEDLHYKTHANYLLLESWYDYNFEDFEFFILKGIDYECDREYIYRLEQNYIDDYLINRRPLFNIVLSAGKRQGDERYLNLPAKTRFKELFLTTFPNSDITEEELEEIIDYDIDSIEGIMECIDDITLKEFEGISLFLVQNRANRGVAKWKYDSFDICECSLTGCEFYDRENNFCNKYEEHMGEMWYAPPWCYKFESLYLLDLERYTEDGFRIIHRPTKGDD